MSKHTPGPWYTSRKTPTSNRVRISGPGWARFAKVVVRMEGGKTDNAIGAANARLIAAAPDLLAAAGAALFVLRIVYQREPGTNEAGAIAELERAIALATVQP